MLKKNIIRNQTWKAFFGHAFLLCISGTITDGIINHYNLIKPEEELSLKDWAISLLSTFLLYGLLRFLSYILFEKRN